MGMKAILLAAGRGERMKALTDVLPKPLIAVGSRPLIEYNIERLKNVGISEIIINVSYRADQVIEYLGDGNRYGVNITYSREPEPPLGTGGGIFKALTFFSDDPFLVLSSDIWTDFPFHTLLDRCQNEDAHLVLVDNPDFHTQGDYGLLDTGKLSLTQLPKFTYASFAVMHPRLFRGCKPGYCSLIPLLERSMKASMISGELYRGQWFNVGTMEELQRLESSLQFHLKGYD